MERYQDIHEIIKDFLWLGNFKAAINLEDLKNKGIKKILSLWEISGFEYDSEEFIHKTIAINDNYDQNIIQYFGECINFIKGKDKVFVHCMAGASRSASIVIAYIMWSQKKTFSEAYNFVKSIRSIFPNSGFQHQLKNFEELLVENDYKIDNINFKDLKWEVDSEPKYIYL